MAAEAQIKENTDTFDWVRFIFDREYDKIKLKHKNEKNKYSCRYFQLFIIILYHMYDQRYKPFMSFLKTEVHIKNAKTRKLLGSHYVNIQEISRVVNAINMIIEMSRSHYLHKYYVIQLFTDSDILSNNIIPIDTLASLQKNPNTMYPMIIYKNINHGTNKQIQYLIIHYFIILYQNDTYYIISQWKSDYIDTLPTIKSIDESQFNKILEELSTSNYTNECGELLKDFFLETTNTIQFNGKKNEYPTLYKTWLTPEKRQALELEAIFSTKIPYKIGFINRYNEHIHEMIQETISKKGGTQKKSIVLKSRKTRKHRRKVKK